MATAEPATVTPAPSPVPKELASEDVKLVQSLMTLALTSVPTLLTYADKVPVVNSAVKYALPTIEPYAKRFVTLSEPVVTRVDEQLTVVYKSVKDTSVVKTLATTKVPQLPVFQLPLSNSFSALLEVSDNSVEYWLADSEEAPAAAAAGEKKEVTVSTLTSKISKRAQKKFNAKLDQIKLTYQPTYDAVSARLLTTKALALNTFEVGKTYSLKFYAAPVETSKTVYAETVTVASAKKEELAAFLETQRKVLLVRFQEFLALIKSKSAALPQKEEVVKRAGKVAEKFQSVNLADVSKYVLIKLRVKGADTSLKTEDVELKVLDLLYSLGQVVFLEELIARGNAVLKSATAA